MKHLKLSLKDFTRIKELPSRGSLEMSSLDFSFSEINLLEFICEELNHYNSVKYKVVNTSNQRDFIIWKDKCVWFTQFNRENTIKWYDYFSISSTSNKRGVFHSNKFSL